jgi:nucleoporin SEH1
MSTLSVSLAQSSTPSSSAAAVPTPTAAATTASAHDRSEQPPGGVAHTVAEVSRLDCHGAPVWRVAFNDDGQILGSAGDDGRLMLYRQRADETWAKSSELGLVKAHMAVPPEDEAAA